MEPQIDRSSRGDRAGPGGAISTFPNSQDDAYIIGDSWLATKVGHPGRPGHGCRLGSKNPAVDLQKVVHVLNSLQREYFGPMAVIHEQPLEECQSFIGGSTEFASFRPLQVQLQKLCVLFYRVHEVIA